MEIDFISFEDALCVHYVMISRAKNNDESQPYILAQSVFSYTILQYNRIETNTNNRNLRVVLSS